MARPADKKLAVVNGETITEKQVQTEAAADLDRLEAKRLQFESGLARDKQTAIGESAESR